MSPVLYFQRQQATYDIQLLLTKLYLLTSRKILKEKLLTCKVSHICKKAGISTLTTRCYINNIFTCINYYCSDKFYGSLVAYIWLHLGASQLRWPNTVFARAFADAIQHVHKNFKKQTCRQ